MQSFIRWIGILSLAGWMAIGAAAADQSLGGFVRDASGAAVPGARATLTHAGTGMVREMLTNDRGYYLFTNLPIGGYELGVELESFQPVRIATQVTGKQI